MSLRSIAAKIAKALGTEETAKKLAEELSTAIDEQEEAFGEISATATKAEKAVKAAEAKAKKLEADLAAKSGTEAEEVAKLKAERDAAQQAIEAAKGEAGKVRLDYALREAAREAGMRDLDALKMLDVSKVALDEATGKLTGADKLFKAAKEAKPYLFEAAKPEPQQPGPGAPPKLGAGPGGGTETPEDKASALAASVVKTVLGSSAQPGGGWGAPAATAAQPGSGWGGAGFGSAPTQAQQGAVN